MCRLERIGKRKEKDRNFAGVFAGRSAAELLGIFVNYTYDEVIGDGQSDENVEYCRGIPVLHSYPSVEYIKLSDKFIERINGVETLTPDALYAWYLLKIGYLSLPEYTIWEYASPFFVPSWYIMPVVVAELYDIYNAYKISKSKVKDIIDTSNNQILVRRALKYISDDASVHYACAMIAHRHALEHNHACDKLSEALSVIFSTVI
ncbi:MAG: hypothetical protein JZD41_02285 [Thermoproteus sp.]|nr:hypothetical protein [Thermoproteus sp.]